MAVIFDTRPITLSANSNQPLAFPSQLTNNRVVGFDVQNFSPFEFVLLGIPGSSVYHFQPFTGMYIPIPFVPDILGIQPIQSGRLILQIGATTWFPNQIPGGGGISSF